MNKIPPRGGRGPSKNVSTPDSIYFGNKPPINNSLNAHSEYTWVNPKQNPLSPQFIPPKSSPVSRIPPKLPPVPKAGLGLGKMGAGLRGGLPGIALIVTLTLLEWWLDQPAPPPPTTDPSSAGSFDLDINKTYRITASAKIKNTAQPATLEALGQIFNVSGATKITAPKFERNGQVQDYAFYAVSPNGQRMRYGIQPAVISPLIWEGVSVSLTVLELTSN